jgi:hypothetical protein
VAAARGDQRAPSRAPGVRCGVINFTAADSPALAAHPACDEHGAIREHGGGVLAAGGIHRRSRQEVPRSIVDVRVRHCTGAIIAAGNEQPSIRKLYCRRARARPRQMSATAGRRPCACWNLRGDASRQDGAADNQQNDHADNSGNSAPAAITKERHQNSRKSTKYNCEAINKMAMDLGACLHASRMPRLRR